MFIALFLTAFLLAGDLYHPYLSGAEATTRATQAAHDGEKATEKNERDATPDMEIPVVTRHTITVKGKELAYVATAGKLPIQNDDGETEAQVFFVAYTVQTSSRETKRPLLFIFNGGPGASAVWLHLGAVGPRIVRMLPDGRMPSPPFNMLDNDTTWLEWADLVFIDPVGTGYSRATKTDLTKKFTTVQGDVDSVGRFIRLYLGRYERWGGPLFLAGESYGAFRAAGLSEYLLEHGIALNGIILISSVMNMQTLSFDQGNELPYALFLPSYTATAWYHRKLPPELQADLDKTLDQAESWAATDYTTALFQGDSLTPEKRREVADKLAEFTGLDAAFIANRNLRIDNRSFVRELLRDRQQMVGYMDSRFTAPDLEPSSHRSFDPTVATIRPPYTDAFNRYIRTELGYKSDQEYFVLGGGIGHWDWEAKNSYADTSDNLRNSFAKNPYMKLFVAMGLFDLATPHFSSTYTLNHLGLPPALRKNISIRHYRAGHMMYLDGDSRRELNRDVKAFVEKALAERP
ncbi:S10 family peptidase [Geobacter sp. AOG2]|uniref:S10 family peptidase n=1 Tax=Geobacter sp. AOG2 TaxID=1566347 RepID=UPI001CC48799|nr:peptidase S10 [Geobacter sp. AOG2]GFE60746.1 peptidase S10 [Geobacter sp. AOG2]